MTTNEAISEEFLRAVPKTDLHVHLDGSLRLDTLIRLARAVKLPLPSETEAGLKETVFKDSYQNLGEYLRCFGLTVAAMQTAEALEQTAYELAQDNQMEGVRYVEVRFAPQLHVRDGLDAVQVVQAVDKGLKRAKLSFNQTEAVRSGKEPPFEYGIICCAMRMFRAGFSEYYTNLMRAHQYAPPKQVFAFASLEMARAAVIARDEHGLPVVGFDLVGEEHGYPADDHVEAFNYAHKKFLKKTVHAGEAYGPESIFQAITDLHAERIGHGTYLLDPESITHGSIVDKEQYIDKLGQYIADRRIALEICLSSNLQTNPHMSDLSDHPFAKLRAHRLSTTICTDNRTVSNTTVTRELGLAIKAGNLTRREIKSIIIYGFKRSFFPGTYLNKRQYVRSVIDYYDAVERKFHGEAYAR